ncbi:DUF1016 N-terminal domain-containing protein [Aeromonas veronii]|uniref:DUF1016 N-terminal domain-containing protein n=1 Tax=Aeromonas veronii TaxID=654 RepID=UPI0024437978|nr:DUF1016 N-terminal domain-containing protein [Aeromonas veronii]
MNTTPLIPAGYTDWLAGIKKEIAQARSRAALAVNAELVRLYGRIGQEIVQRQAEQGWGGQGDRPTSIRPQRELSGYARLVEF